MDARDEKRCWHAAAALDGERRNRAVKFSMGKKGPSRPPEDQPRAVLVESRGPRGVDPLGGHAAQIEDCFVWIYMR